MKNKAKIAALALMTFSLSGCALIDSITGKDECEHQWGPWETIEKATCSKKGKKAHVCELCGEEREKSTPIEPENHKWKSDSKNDVEATCTSTGIEGSKKCSYCGELLDGEVTPKAEHSWVSIQEEQQPEGFKKATCSEEGVYFEKCNDCNVISEARIEAKADHDYIDLGKNGIVAHVGCENCDLDAYDFEIKEASGWNGGVVNADDLPKAMNSITSPNNISTWNINVGQVPAGFYDVMISAKTVKEKDRKKKYYNMEKGVLAENEEIAAADKEINAVWSANLDTDQSDQDDFRYTIKVDDTEFTPQQTKSFEDLGLESDEMNGTKYHFVKFVDGITVDANSNKISLCHNNLATSLIIQKVRLVKHTHEGIKKTYGAENGQVAYEVESCSCGYRKITINAKDGAFGNGMSSVADQPNGYIKLDKINDFVTYDFVARENIVGNLYMVGRQDSYPTNKDKNPYNCSWYINDEPVVLKNSSASSEDIFGEAADPNLEGYSNEAAALIGKVELPKDDNIVIKYVKNGEFNPSLRQIVIEGRQANHICKWERDPDHDESPSCTTAGTLAYKCECGKTKTEASTTPIGHIYNGEAVVITAPSCTADGEMTIECSRCHEKSPVNIPIPATHSMQAVDVGEGESYKLDRCVVCGESEVNWDLTSNMIQDLTGDVYSVSSTVINKTGAMSNGKTMSVFKFDKANRKVDLSFYNDTNEAKEVTFKMLTTAKITDVSNCKMYNNRFAIDVVYNDGSDHPVTFDSNRANKTLEDLGVKPNKSSKVYDNNIALADAEWIDYCTFTIGAGRNTISFKVADEAELPVYIGGFALSYTF